MESPFFYINKQALVRLVMESPFDYCFQVQCFMHQHLMEQKCTHQGNFFAFFFSHFQDGPKYFLNMTKTITIFRVKILAMTGVEHYFEIFLVAFVSLIEV